MSGLVLLLLAEALDIASSAASWLSGHGVEANPLLPHDLERFLAAKCLVCAGAIAVWLLAGRARAELEVAYLVCAGALLAVSLHNLGIAQRFV